MPILIDDVILEVSDNTSLSGTAEPLQQQVPAAAAEQELLQTLALVKQRQERLSVD